MSRGRAALGIVLAAASLAVLASTGCAGQAPREDRSLWPVRERPGVLLVTLRAGAERSWRPLSERLLAVYGLQLVGSWPIHATGELCLVVTSRPWLSRARAIDQLEAERDVSGAYPLRHYRVLAGEPDPHLTLQSAGVGLPLADLHRVATGRGVTVAVIDTGVDIDHPELAGRVRKAVDFAGSGRGGRFTAEFHGTAVAGVVAALAGNGRGGAGIAPEAELWAFRACWQEPRRARTAFCDSATLVQALDRVVIDRPRIVNLSLAGEPDPLIERLLRIAIERGTVVIAAVEGPELTFPASVPGVVAVDGVRRGKKPVVPELAAGALVAPGSDLLTTVPSDGYDFVSGSSFAAAWTTGLVALLLEHGVEPSSIRERLRAATAVSGGDDLPRIDGCAALAGAIGSDPCAADEP